MTVLIRKFNTALTILMTLIIEITQSCTESGANDVRHGSSTQFGNTTKVVSINVRILHGGSVPHAPIELRKLKVQASYLGSEIWATRLRAVPLMLRCFKKYLEDLNRSMQGKIGLGNCLQTINGLHLVMQEGQWLFAK